ncbi:DUF2690 domain-containing protein [Streptomyces chitinivorans]|uniref:DUF2690 domain-containing protein n=1 Tax=Streptomyces chitinivorans TaxID=1257027 RepID=A0ABW7HQJ6_9ACTN|nr:DUF2690 domain-containing protein [Streptomyces chitinivorans]MDH2410298.1 DUF2690 domain-containing protein [Streptomyces chitinivorans]
MTDRDEARPPDHGPSDPASPDPGAPASGTPGGRPAPRPWWRRLAGWTSRHSPQTLMGALLITLLGTLTPVVVEKVWGDDEPKAAAPPADGKPLPVPSASCSGETCLHLDPKDPGCDARVVTLAERTEPVSLQIRYSTVCEAAWGRIRQARVGDKVRITTADGEVAVDSVEVGHDAYTRMVPASGEFELTACVDADAAEGKPRWPRACVTATNADVP